MTKRILLALCGLSLLLTFGFVVAYWSHVLARTAPRGARLEPPASRLEIRAPKVAIGDPDLFVASEIGKAYHRPDCFYAAKQTKHKITFKTRAEAEASGRHACTNCLAGLAQSANE